MTTCVVGAGAIGSLYAGHLAQVGASGVLTRRPEHAAALRWLDAQLNGTMRVGLPWVRGGVRT